MCALEQVLKLGSNTVANNVKNVFFVEESGFYAIALKKGRGGNYTVNGTETNYTDELEVIELGMFNAGDEVTFIAQYGDDVVLLKLPEGTKSISEKVDTVITSVTSDNLVPIYFLGTAGLKYKVTVNGENVVLADENGTPLESAVIATDSNGGVYAYLKYTGEGAGSGEVTLSVVQALDLGAASLIANKTYVFVATQDGDYTISGVKLTKGKTFSVNGEAVIDNSAGTTTISNQTYTLQGVKAGDEIIITSQVAQKTFAINLVTD